MTIIAVDAMGGDHAPVEIVHGSVIAAREYKIGIQLVGLESLIKKELEKHSALDLPIEVIPADEVVDMGEKQPAIAVRKKSNSSIVVSMNQVANGKAHGVVAAGNTGAATAAALFCLKRIEGIERPCIGCLMPAKVRPFILADGGANVEATPEQIVQNAIMGSALSKAIFKIKNPRVGLLNIGEEPGKGSTLYKETFELLQKIKDINFIGNVQGREVPEGICDVCACDGFVGNVFLKTAEGIVKMVTSMLREELTRDSVSKVSAFLAKGSLYRLKKRIDYSEFGGAQLLGVKGVCVIAHGSSRHIAIKNAIRVAKEAVEGDIVSNIESMVNSCVK